MGTDGAAEGAGGVLPLPDDVRPAFLPPTLTPSGTADEGDRPSFLPEVPPSPVAEVEQQVACEERELVAVQAAAAEESEPPTAASAGVSLHPEGAECAALPRLPNFTGRWRMSNYEGDMEELMVDSGLGWAIRKLAKSMNYGVGKQSQDIRQDGDDFTINLEGAGPKASTMRFRVGAGTQQTQGPAGAEWVVDPIWQGEALYMPIRDPKGKAMPEWTRRLEGDTMVLESTSFSGRLVRRVFTCEGGRPAPPPVAAQPPMGLDAGALGVKAAAAASPASEGIAPAAPTPTPATDSAFGAQASHQGEPPSEAVGVASGAQRSRPDFRGVWLLDRIEGDIEGLMTDSGSSWPIRQLAKGMGYGVRKLTQDCSGVHVLALQDISQDGDLFSILSAGLPKVTTMQFRVAAGEQEVQGPDGAQVVVDPRWVGERLQMLMRKPGKAAHLPRMDRYIEGQEMVLEAQRSNGEVVKRIFVLVTPPRVAVPSALGTSADHTAAAVGAACSSTPCEGGVPNFAGKWILHSVEGDYDAFLKDAGVPWYARKLAKRGLHVGGLTQTITQAGNCFTIVHDRAGTVTTSRFEVGAGEQDVICAYGPECVVRPFWELNQLVMYTVKPWAPIQRRFMEGPNMVVEASTSEGITKQIFARAASDMALLAGGDALQARAG